MKKMFLGLLVAMVAALSFSLAQAAQSGQIDGLQSGNATMSLPKGLHVYVNPGDLGDALIGGYYNARGSLDMISLVNTSMTEGVAVKVRFREGKYSNEVLDFFVCLSAGDRWTAWVYGDNNPNDPAHLYVWDNDTPTCPTFGGSPDKAFHYSATGAASCVTADMTKEGYFTVIGVSSWADTPGDMKVVKTDKECCAVLGQADAGNFTIPDPLRDVDNCLTGTVTIYDIVDGAAAYGYNMTALADFMKGPVSNPGLGLDNPPTLVNCQDRLDGLNYVLTKKSLIALYDIEDFWKAQTDVIITFPTKTQTLKSFVTSKGATQNPFQGAVAKDNCGWTSDPCEPVKVHQWDDAEHTPTITHGFSPSTTTDLELCNEVNYITVGENAASILNTDLLQFSLGEAGYDIGWINFDFTKQNVADRVIGLSSPTAASPDAMAYAHGLPAIGYELGSFVQGYYGHMLPLRYTTDVNGTNVE